MRRTTSQLKILACCVCLGSRVAFAQNETSGAPTPNPDSEEYRLDQIVVESSPLRETLFNSALPVSELSGVDLDLKARGSLGDTLALEPGVSSSSFAPGAGRPVIRGLSGDRVRVLENGIGTLDVSDVSPDHAVTVESALVEQIEVIRGPAALLYGTSAVGGLVNVFDKRIAERLQAEPVTGTVEIRGESVDLERAGLFGLDAAAGSLMFHLDGMKSVADDIDIPGYARTPQLRATEPLDYPEPQGQLPWSDVSSDNLTLGSSYIFDNGFLGASVSDYNTNYGVPNGEEDVSVDAHRRRVDARGGIRNTGMFVEEAKVRVGVVNYDHTEYQAGEAGTEFTQHALEGRADLNHRALGDLTGTFGAQLQMKDFEAEGEEAFQPPTDTEIYSLFDLEEYKISNSLTFQLGGRFDWTSVESQGFSGTGEDAGSRFFDTFSQSTGLVWDMDEVYSLALSVAHTERAPNGQELYADGPHVATGAYEIGDPNLDSENSLGTDLTFRKNTGQFRGFIGGFYNHFWNYINLSPTGEENDGLPVYLFDQIEADFVGFEAQAQYFVKDSLHEEWSFDIQPDYVWARSQTTGEYIPRMPPFRLLMGSTYSTPSLGRTRLEVQQVFAQNNVAEYETTTAAYTMLNAYYSREFMVGTQAWEIFLRGTNLLSEKARNAVSFTKDVAPLPGASAMLGVRYRF